MQLNKLLRGFLTQFTLERNPLVPKLWVFTYRDTEKGESCNLHLGSSISAVKDKSHGHTKGFIYSLVYFVETTCTCVCRAFVFDLTC